MLIAVTALALVCGLVLIFISTAKDWADDGSIGAVLTVASFIALTIMILIMAFNQLGAEGTVAELKTEYAGLMYQFENNLYDNDNDIGKKELYNDILKYNKKVAVGKVMQHSKWLGAFYPKIYDQFELIDLKGE